MSGFMIQDSLKVAVNEVVSKTAAPQEDSINWWIWIAIAEFGIIAYLLFKRRSIKTNSAKRQFKEESLKQEIDFNNVINSSFNSTALYNDLKVKCHPDRFPENEKENAIANTLFQEITKSKRNLKRLLELKEEAKNKLSINF